jgi:hypothetical protein
MSIKELSVEECIEQIEAISVGLPRDGHDHDEEYSHHEQRKIIHKVDRRLITGLGLLFGVSLMDRTNLGNMSIAGYALQVHQSVDLHNGRKSYVHNRLHWLFTPGQLPPRSP